MIERILLVDYENIQAVDLAALTADVKVRFVLGGKQGKLPSELAIQAHAIGERFAYERGYLVRRVGAQKEAFGAVDSHPGSDFDRLTSLLKKEKAQPRKRKGLEGKVKGWFQSMAADKRAELVQRLFDEGFVNETDKLLTFVSARFRGV